MYRRITLNYHYLFILKCLRKWSVSDVKMFFNIATKPCVYCFTYKHSFYTWLFYNSNYVSIQFILSYTCIVMLNQLIHLNYY